MEAYYEIGSSADKAIDSFLAASGNSIESIYEMHRQMTSNFALISFSSTHTDLPLWAYYASNFGGMCLEFATSEIVIGDLQNESLVPVTYAQNPLRPLSFSDFSPKQLNKSTNDRLTRKRIEWAHEREWRFLTGQIGPKYYLDDALKRVFLGPRVKAHHAEQICALLDRRPVEILQGEIKGFELSFRQIKCPRSLKECERVGSGKFDPPNDLYAEPELTKFLSVHVSKLYDECQRTALRPNMEAFAGIDITTNNPNTVYLWTIYKLRNGRDVYQKRYFDRRMRSIPQPT